MKPMRMLLVLILTGLGLSACSLAGDIPPPPDYSPPVTQEVTRVETNFPLMPPDPARGKVIYDESCEPCHGPTGLGNGSQAADLPVQVPLLGNADVARAAAPVDWFNTVTYGNIERLMPPFGGSLTDRQRWDVVAYVYTLSMPAEQLAEGAGIYTAQCQDCHGELGRGDGALAVSQNLTVANWIDPARLAKLSNQQIWEMISGGVLGTSMPAYADLIYPDQRWAVTNYVRSLSFSQPSTEAAGTQEQPVQVEEIEAPQTLPQEGLGNVRVNVINGSGEEIPTGLLVSLTGYDDMQSAISLSGTLEAGGSTLFEGVEKPTQRVYLASVEYDGLTFYSDIVRLADSTPGEEVQVSVTIYENTTDTSQLSAERVHVFLEFPEPGRLQIAQLFLITNPTGRVIVPVQEGQPVLEFELPQGASDLQFADSAMGERYIETAKGFGDLANIAPGQTQHQVLYAYELPYERKLSLQLRMPLDVQSAVVALPQIDGLRLTSPQLRESGQRQVEGTSLHLFSASNLAGGSLLELTVSGRPGSRPMLSSGPAGSLILGGGLFALVVVLGVVWLRQQRRQAAPVAGSGETVEEPEAVETLLDAILALDDQYRSGELPLEAYKERRAALKERLRAAKIQEAQER
jgi:cbb3-type cytochrome c oxidase subunit III